MSPRSQAAVGNQDAQAASTLNRTTGMPCVAGEPKDEVMQPLMCHVQEQAMHILATMAGEDWL